MATEHMHWQVKQTPILYIGDADYTILPVLWLVDQDPEGWTWVCKTFTKQEQEIMTWPLLAINVQAMIYDNDFERASHGS